MPLDLEQTLKDLISIPSVSPMGPHGEGPEFYEDRLTDYLEGVFRKLRLPWARQAVAPRRDNIFGWLEGAVPPDKGGQVILFEAHQDTVPTAGMTIPPWTPEVREGRMYGRGSCDVKGGMAAMLGALARLAEERPPGHPTVVVAGSVNEENGYTGARAMVKLWEPGTESPFPGRPTAAVVAEPTHLEVVIAHKGQVRWRCRTRGRAAHSSQPELGENAIYRMSAVLQAFESYQAERIPTLGSHPLCGRPSLSVGTITGGLSVSTVPDACTIEIDRRVLPGEDPLEARKLIVEYVNAAVDFPLEHDEPFLMGGPLAEGASEALAGTLLRAVESVAGRGETVGVPFGTDASLFAATGVPSVVFGPGGIEQAHTADEWLELSELHQASEILYRIACAGIPGS